MKHFNIKSKSSVTLIDDCPINIECALKSGYNAVQVSKGISDKSYFDHLPGSPKTFSLDTKLVSNEGIPVLLLIK